MRISNIKIREDLSEEELIKVVCKREKINVSKISSWNIVKKSIDARKKDDVHYNYTIDFIFLNEEEENKEDLLIVKNPRKIIKKPIVIGAGPAGLFAAYTLALNGANPIIIEQGKSVEKR